MIDVELTFWFVGSRKLLPLEPRERPIQDSASWRFVLLDHGPCFLDTLQ
jgi:hypothetical protein